MMSGLMLASRAIWNSDAAYRMRLTTHKAVVGRAGPSARHRSPRQNRRFGCHPKANAEEFPSGTSINLDVEKNSAGSVTMDKLAGIRAWVDSWSVMRELRSRGA